MDLIYLPCVCVKENEVTIESGRQSERARWNTRSNTIYLLNIWNCSETFFFKNTSIVLNRKHFQLDFQFEFIFFYEDFDKFRKIIEKI